MHGVYDHSGRSKQTQYRSNKPPSEPYFEYDPNPYELNKRKPMIYTPKKEPDAVVVHKLCFMINFAFTTMGFYFLAKLIFLLYNAGDSIECILNHPG